MEPGISSQSRTKNEERLIELLPEASDVPENGKLDNDSNHNNNDSSDVHCASSFMQLRDQHSAHSYKVSDDNRSLASLRNSSCVENICNPRSAWLTSRGSVRRHSVGLDDFSGLSIYSGHTNSNQEKRPPIFDHSPISHCSSDTTANCPYTVCPPKAQFQNECAKSENQNNPRNIEFAVRSPCNGSPRRHSPVNFNPAQTYEKLKDKSFMRKSSLNRLEFVGQACHTTVCASSQSHMSNKQQSSSEANSDQEHSRSLATASSTCFKRKSNSSRRVEKETFGGLSRQDALQENVSHENNLSCLLNSRYREGSLKFRNRKNPKSLTSHFKKKSYSAGEQDSYTDFAENSGKNKVCFSAQELKHNCTYKEFSHLSFENNSSKSVASQKEYKQADAKETEELVHSNEELKKQTCCFATCDNPSHVCEKDELPKPDDVVEEGDSHSLKSFSRNNLHRSDSSTKGTDVTCAEHVEIDQDIFCSHSFVPSPPPLRCYPTDDSLTPEFTSHEDNEICAQNPQYTACSRRSVTCVTEELSCLEKTTEPVELQNVKSCSPIEPDIESTRQRSSILRKKCSEEKKEIHGILKNTEEKLASRQLPSILKHRESSEEKDSWLQSDLHSILKKSTSEDESSNNSPDIRPILKNTSTDDESSGLSSKPKPILKKRTSFSEECSYACFHGGELKPILKKKSVIDASEEQPKPILKTRRKSEEAAAIMSEFAVGSRPRAYSADRGMKKNLDDELT